MHSGVTALYIYWPYTVLSLQTHAHTPYYIPRYRYVTFFPYDTQQVVATFVFWTHLVYACSQVQSRLKLYTDQLMICNVHSAQDTMWTVQCMMYSAQYSPHAIKPKGVDIVTLSPHLCSTWPGLWFIHGGSSHNRICICSVVYAQLTVPTCVHSCWCTVYWAWTVISARLLAN